MEIISYFIISIIIIFLYRLLLSWNIKRNVKNEKIYINDTKVDVINEGIFFKTQEIFDFNDIEEIKVLKTNLSVKKDVYVLESLQISIRYKGDNNYYEHVSILNIKNSLLFIKKLKIAYPQIYFQFIISSMFIVPNVLKILESSMENI